MNKSLIHLVLGIIAVILTLVGVFIFLNSTKDYNCADFETHKQAQNKFNENKDDPYHLDRDHDGIACEGLK